MDSNFYNSLEQRISKSRLSTYKDSTNIDTITNYIVNAKLSQNFYFLLQNLEVSLRNSIYNSFKKYYPNSDFFYLYETNSFNRYKSRKEKHSRECWKMLCGVKYKLRHINNLTDGKIISELNFGFWTELLSSKDKKYINIWRKIFKDVFPNYNIKNSIDKEKTYIALQIDEIRQFRNRIFHYEPILNHNIEHIHNSILDILYFINKDIYSLTKNFDTLNSIEKEKETIYNKLKGI